MVLAMSCDLLSSNTHPPRQHSPYADYQFALLSAAKGIDTAAALWTTSIKAQWAFARAQWNEWAGASVALKEPEHHFSIEQNFRAGKIPETKVSSEILTDFPFCRVWSFDRVEKTPDAPTFLIVAPYSGTDDRIMSDAVSALLPIGNVRLIGQRDRHRVPFPYTNGHEDAISAIIEVARINPRCHLVTFSESGTKGAVTTAWMYQNPEFKGKEPPYIMVGPYWPGAGHLVFPGAVSKMFMQKEGIPKKILIDADNQSMPAEHVRDTQNRVFRQFLLAKEKYEFRGRRVDTHAITCPVHTFAGELDDIVRPAQTHDLHRLTPNASSRVCRTIAGTDHYDLVGRRTLTEDIIPIIKQSIGVSPTAALAPQFNVA
jgi:poly-beta-hydroxyalkanoate depolymerase